MSPIADEWQMFGKNITVLNAAGNDPAKISHAAPLIVFIPKQKLVLAEIFFAHRLPFFNRLYRPLLSLIILLTAHAGFSIINKNKALMSLPRPSE
jgi:hypothetical protein